MRYARVRSRIRKKIKNEKSALLSQGRFPQISIAFGLKGRTHGLGAALRLAGTYGNLRCMTGATDRIVHTVVHIAFDAAQCLFATASILLFHELTSSLSC